jgi:hypothetical protein
MNELRMRPKPMQSIQMPEVVWIFAPHQKLPTRRTVAVKNGGDKVAIEDLVSAANHFKKLLRAEAEIDVLAGAEHARNQIRCHKALGRNPSSFFVPSPKPTGLLHNRDVWMTVKNVPQQSRSRPLAA